MSVDKRGEIRELLIRNTQYCRKVAVHPMPIRLTGQQNARFSNFAAAVESVLCAYSQCVLVNSTNNCPGQDKENRQACVRISRLKGTFCVKVGAL